MVAIELVVQILALVQPWMLVTSLIADARWSLYLRVSIFVVLVVGMLSRAALRQRVPIARRQ